MVKVARSNRPVARLSAAMATAATAALLAAAPAAGIGGGTPTVIDDFSTNQPTLTLTFPPAGTSASSSVAGAGILGGERDNLINLTAGVIAGNSLSSTVSSGFLSYSQDATISGNGHVSWDGADGSPTLDPTGLGGVDLTAGGTQNALDLAVFFDDLPLNITLTVTSATGTSAATVASGGLIFSATHFVVPFSAFSATSGSGADFANVGAIELTQGSAVTAPDVVTDSVATDALLAAPMTAALTDDINGNTLADPGDRVTYTTTISNPDDAFDASSPGTSFALTPDPDSALLAGSVTTTQGTVTTGNGGGDTSVAVDVGAIADGASATIAADVTVSPNPTSPLSAQGTVGGGGLTALLTDDPGVAGNADPTLMPVVENTAPTAADDAYAVVGGTTLTVAAPGVLANDSDPNGDPLTAVSPVGPSHGTLTLNPNGSFTYTPAAGFTGPDAFAYRASDPFAQSPPATVTIAVSAPAAPPPPPVAPPPPPPPPPVSPLPPPAPSSFCARRPVLIDVQRVGDRVAIKGIGPAGAAGHTVGVQALVNWQALGAPASATVASDGTFALTVPLPAEPQRSAVRYRASLDGLRSRTLKLERKLMTIALAGTRVTGQLKVPGSRKVTITHETCDGSKVLKTLRASATGRFTTQLPASAPGAIELYRARAVVKGARTFSVVIVVRG